MKALGGIQEKGNCYDVLHYHLYLPDMDVPQKPENRKRTDSFFLIAFAICIAVYLSFLLYSLYYSDIYRLRGYDSYGNVCSKRNSKYDGWNYTGKDFTLKPLLINGDCSDTYWTTAFSDFSLLAQRIAVASTIPLVLCLILVALFRFAPALAVWGILIGSWLTFSVFSIVLLSIERVAMSVVSTLLLVVLVFNVNKIRVVTIQLGEATRATFRIKMLLSVPIITLLVLLTMSAIHIVANLYAVTAGRLTQIGTSYYRYYPDNYMTTTWFLNPIMFIWIVHFVFGIQDAVVSGAIAKWYSTRKQDDATDTVSTSLLATFGNHLGTIALVSLLNVIMLGPRIVLKCLTQVTALKEIVDCCISYFDGFFSNDLYIMTATHGTSFVQSGKKAARLLKSSMGSSMGVNSFGDFVIALGQILVVVISTLCAFVIHMLFYHNRADLYLLIIDFGVAYVVACSTLGTLKLASNTIFFCVVEEFSNNQEASCPYTVNTREFVSGSNKEYMRKVQNKRLSDLSKKFICMKVFFVIFACCVGYALLYIALR